MAIKFADTARPNNSATTTNKGTFPVAIANDVWFNDGDSLEEKWANINTDAQTIQMDELPTATEELFGTVYQYIGNTTDDYTNGYFYQCAIVDDGSGGTAYGWVEKEVQSGTLTISEEEGQQIQQLEDGLYVHIDDWMEDVDLLPMGEDINNVMYRSTLGEPSIYIDAQITTKDEVIQALEDRGFVLDSASSSQSTKVYTVPTGTTWQFLYKYIPTGDENIKVWTTFHKIEILYNNNDLINTVSFKNLNGETITSLGGISTFKLRIFLRDINRITNEYFYIGNATSQTTKRVALYDELPSSVEISEEEGNRIQKLSDGIYVGESISSVDCIAVEDITDVNNIFEEGKFYYDCTDGKVYKATSTIAYEESDAVPMHVEITDELYQTLTNDQINSEITWFITDLDHPFEQADISASVLDTLQTIHTESTPTENSTKYVTSGGIYNALNDSKVQCVKVSPVNDLGLTNGASLTLKQFIDAIVTKYGVGVHNLYFQWNSSDYISLNDAAMGITYSLSGAIICGMFRSTGSAWETSIFDIMKCHTSPDSTFSTDSSGYRATCSYVTGTSSSDIRINAIRLNQLAKCSNVFADCDREINFANAKSTSFFKNRYNEGIVTFQIMDKNQNGLNIDFDADRGEIRYYKMTAGEIVTGYPKRFMCD